MISLVIPPKDQVSRIVKMLADEYGTASNIKSRVNRYGCLQATHRDFYAQIPPIMLRLSSPCAFFVLIMPPMCHLYYDCALPWYVLSF